MKNIWSKEDPMDDHGTIFQGCTLNAKEAELLTRLAGTLTRQELIDKGFTHDEGRIIQDWYNGGT